MRKLFWLMILLFAGVGLLWWAAPDILPEPLKAFMTTLFGPRETPIVTTIEVRSDKTSYRPDEVIQVTQLNTSKEPIRSYVASITPVYAIEAVERRKPDGSWEKLFAQCLYPNCTYTLDTPREIAAGKSESFPWKPIVYEDGKNKPYRLSPGTYRLLVRHEIQESLSSDEWSSQGVYSNEFTMQ